MFCVLIGHLHIFLTNVYSSSLPIKFFVFLLLSFRSSLYIPSLKRISDIWLQMLSPPLLFFYCWFICLFLFGCSGSSRLHPSFLWWQQVVPPLHCSAGASHCSGSPGLRAQALGAQASGVVARRLACSMACEISLDQESNPRPLHWQVYY